MHSQSSAKNRLQVGALSMLIVLQFVMFASLLAGLAPHPPQTIPISGMGPLIAAGIGLAAAAIIVREGWLGTTISVLAALVALISFGPQKWFDSQVAQTWPAVLCGQVAAFSIILLAVSTLRNSSRAAS